MALKKSKDELEKVVDEIDNEEVRTLGQTATDEDGVVRDEPLLAGIEWEGQFLKTFSYREMNGKDEEAINKAEVRNNGAKLVNTLLERTVVDIGGITKKDMEISKKVNPYIRILGVSNRGKTLISEITRLGNNVPVITSVKKFMTESKNKNLKRLLQIDINATDIYTLGYQKDAYANLDYTHKIITL